MKTLVVTTTAPDAISERQTGTTNYLFRLIQLLKKTHEITLLTSPPVEDAFIQNATYPVKIFPVEPESKQSTRIWRSFSKRIYPSMWHRQSSELRSYLNGLDGNEYDVCWLLDDYAGPYLRSMPAGIPVVFFRHFVLNMGLVEENPSKHPLSFLRLAWHRWIAKAFDKWTTEMADATITGTRESQKNLQLLARESRVDYFATKPFKTPPPVPEEIICNGTRPDKRIQVACLGDMSFSRNAEGVQWFLSDVLPVLSAEMLKRLHFTFIGRKPPEEVMETSTPLETSLEFKGFVDDLETELHQCQAAIIPVFGGNGVRIKTATLLGTGLPAVSTPDGVEGLPVISDKDLIIADTPESFAEGLGDLLSSDKRISLASKCRDTMLHFLSEENDSEKLFSISREICKKN